MSTTVSCGRALRLSYSTERGQGGRWGGGDYNTHPKWAGKQKPQATFRAQARARVRARVRAGAAPRAETKVGAGAKALETANLVVVLAFVAAAVFGQNEHKQCGERSRHRVIEKCRNEQCKRKNKRKR